jgi:predicted nucleic acid-binding protein
MIALDTNVLIYCCDKRDPRRQKIAMDLVADTTEGSPALAGRVRVHRRLAFWDATLVGACLETGVSRLYSEDLPGTKIESLEIVSPFA